MKEIFSKKILLAGILLPVFCLIFSFGAVSVQAAGMISVDFEDSPLFEIDNFYPGMSVSKNVSVKNEDAVERDLYITMSGMDNDDFADQINFYVIKKSSGKFFVGGSGDRMTLKDMDEDGNAFVERMAAGDSTDYEIRVKLKTDTGNEFQNEEIDSFKVGMAFFDLPNPASPPYRPGQLAGGNEEGEVEGAESNDNEEAEPVEEDGVVSGEQNECHSWPLWAWILSAIIYAIVFLWSIFSGLEKQRKERNVRRVWPTILVIGAFLFWYNFDKCERFQWFIIFAAIFSVLSYLYYLKIFKKKVIIERES